MKLYLSSYRIPVPDKLARLTGKPLSKTSVALIQNANDYYAPRAWEYKAHETEDYFRSLGMTPTTVDLRTYANTKTLETSLSKYDIIWARGGNTFCLNYEMRRSGFDQCIRKLLKKGVVYGGDSAGALVAGPSIAGIEPADIPEFAERVIEEGMSLVPQVIMPHVDNPEFAGLVPLVEELHKDRYDIIKLKDSEAVIFTGDTFEVIANPEWRIN